MPPERAGSGDVLTRASLRRRAQGSGALDVAPGRARSGDVLTHGPGPRARRLIPWWPLPGLLVFVLARLPSFFEPHWYTDEAGYATVARELLRGKRLYVDAWNNKPPLQLWTVALPVEVFGGSEAALHTLTFVSGLLTLAAVAYLGHHLLTPLRAGLALVVAALLLGTPVLDAELIVPESLLIAPVSWAGAVLLTRLHRAGDRPRRLEAWPVVVGVLAAAGVAYQQTAIADAAAFGLILLVDGGLWRRLERFGLYCVTAIGVTAAWLGASILIAGGSRVGYALAGFYVAYTQSVLPQSHRATLLHWGLVFAATALVTVGALLKRGDDRGMAWGLWVWAGATLLVSAAAHQAFAHFLTPTVAPLVLAICSIPAPRHLAAATHRARLAAVSLGAGVLVAGLMGRTAGLDWVPAAAPAGMNGYRTLFVYYYGAAQSAIQPENRPLWDAYFDERVPGDADTGAWIRAHGLSNRTAVVWSNDAWPYLLADLPLLLPTPPIYNDINLFGWQGQLGSRVAKLDPEIIVTSDDSVDQFPDVKPVLRRYRAVHTSGHLTIWLRQDLSIPPASS